jgi:hypothetical protein
MIFTMSVMGVLYRFFEIMSATSSVAPVCTSTNALAIVAGEKPMNSEFVEPAQTKIRAFVVTKRGLKEVQNCTSADDVHEGVKNWVTDHYARGDLIIEFDDEDPAVVIELRDDRHGDSRTIRVVMANEGENWQKLVDELEAILPCSYGNEIGKTTFDYPTPPIPWDQIKSLSKVNIYEKNEWTTGEEYAGLNCCLAIIEKTDGTKMRCRAPMRSIGTFCEHHGCEGTNEGIWNYCCHEAVALGKTRCSNCDKEQSDIEAKK